MARSLKMVKIRKVIEVWSSNQTMSSRQIARICSVDKNTVKKIIDIANELNVSYENIKDKTDSEIFDLFYPNNNPYKDVPEPDVAHYVNELKKPFVTAKRLHGEYLEKHPNGLGYTQFMERIREYIGSNNITAHFERKAGERMEIDWSGDPVYYLDASTNTYIKCIVFVSTIGRSGYTYLEVFRDTKLESFIAGVVNALTYFGGIPKMLVPDNDKSAVITHSKYSLKLNQIFQSLCVYYDTLPFPARVRKPKDKPLVENAVFNAAERELIGSMHNKTFCSFEELSNHVYQTMVKYNDKKFSKKEGSRKSVFIEEDLPELKPLPKTPYEIEEFKRLKVHPDYHIEYKNFYYSVPYFYVAKYVDIVANSKFVVINYDGKEIAKHIRLYGNNRLRYSTIESHMPEKHKKRKKDSYISWANSIDEELGNYIKNVFTTFKVEEQAYRGVIGIIQLSKKNKEILIQACKELNGFKLYGYKHIKVRFESIFKAKNQTMTVINSDARGEDYYKEKLRG